MLVTAAGANRDVEVLGIDVAAAKFEAGIADLGTGLPGREVLERHGGNAGDGGCARALAVAAGSGGAGGHGDTAEVAGVVDAEFQEVRIVGRVLLRNNALALIAVLRRVAEASLEASEPGRQVHDLGGVGRVRSLDGAVRAAPGLAAEAVGGAAHGTCDVHEIAVVAVEAVNAGQRSIDRQGVGGAVEVAQFQTTPEASDI